MSAFNVKRTYKQLMAERNALSYFIRQREEARCSCKLTDKQRAELESDKALLKRIDEDIERARETIGIQSPSRVFVQSSWVNEEFKEALEKTLPKDIEEAFKKAITKALEGELKCNTTSN